MRTAGLTVEEKNFLQQFDDEWRIREQFDPSIDRRVTGLLRSLTRRGYLDSRRGVAAHSMREWARTEKEPGIEYKRD